MQKSRGRWWRGLSIMCKAHSEIKMLAHKVEEILCVKNIPFTYTKKFLRVVFE